MMSRARTAGALLGLLALVATGCGGAEDVPTGTTPAPGSTTPGTTVGGTDTGLNPDGTPIDTTGAEGVTATIPDLEGSNLGGGFGGAGGDVFDVKAVEELEDEDSGLSDGDDLSSGGDFDGVDSGPDTDFAKPDPTPKPEPKPEPKPQFSGAKIYVDGVVHDVDVDGIFPAANPILRLLSVKAGEIEVELVAGEFTAGGGVGVFLDKGELVSMLNGSEQVTYRVKYLRPITATDTPGL